MTATIRTTVPAVRTVAAGGVLAASAGGVALWAYGLLVQATSIPMAAGEPGAAAAQPFTAVNFALGTVLCTFWGTVLAIGLARWAAHPARTFLRSGAVLVAVSLGFPLAAGHTATSTRLALAAGHLLAAAVVIPILSHYVRRASH